MQDKLLGTVPPAGGVTLVGLRVHVRPVLGKTVAVRATAWLNVPMLETVIVEVAAAPARAVADVALAATPKLLVTGTVTVTIAVRLWVWVVGVEVASVAVPVSVTVQVTVEVAVPPNVTTSVKEWPAVKDTDVEAGVTVSPVQPVPATEEDMATGPANPAAVTSAESSDGLLPTVNVSVTVPPEVNETAPPVIDCVTLKSCGRTVIVRVTAFVPLGNVPVARVVTA